ncbi:MAG: hypothetical protein LBC09_07370 [Helicobacteraceae bacterium]|jgi:fumarylacetoacetate (FAA) hydrolase family protein|nr:hypothetical protein [Helicobacteraceae bacterium]
MTLLQARKIVLEAMSQSLNERYLELYAQIGNGRLTTKEARLIGEEINSLEETANYAKSEAEAINRAAVQEAAQEVMAIWNQETK